MPCNCDHLESTAKETEASRIACINDELDGKSNAINPEYWNGYHPRVYGRENDLDGATAALCERLKSVNVGTKSLEVQMWHRDHVAADKEREARERVEAERDREREVALGKLTQHERDLLKL